MVFSDYQTRKHAVECMKIFYDCAEKAGIREHLFVSFGLLLGIVREKDFIKHDNDIDMCLFSERITNEQEIAYFNLLKENELFYAREKEAFRLDEGGYDTSLLKSRKSTGSKPGRLAWFSLRKRHNYPKVCHWLMFPWNGYYWHTKSGAWVKDKKFAVNKWNYDGNTCAIMKGIPEQYISKLVSTEFYGLKINIPLNTGSCLDFYYPGWLVPRVGGASAKKIACFVKNWHDKSTWKVKIL